MKRVIVVTAVVFAVLLGQLTIVNGLVLPGGGTPDLVLICVVVIGMVGGTRAGILAGFLAGFALDLAPPAQGVVGQYALAFTLAGYAAGRLRFTLLRSVTLGVASAAVVTVAAEALATVLVIALGRPPVSLAMAAHVLPFSAVYDAMVMPLAVFLGARLAVMLRVSFSDIGESPVFEPGGSAAPVGLRGLGRPGAPAPTGLAVRGTARPAWFGGDLSGEAPAIGEVGWLTGPARSRRARREQARLAATLAGSVPRKKDGWVGARPGGLSSASPTPGRSARSVRMRSWTGTPGSASGLSWPVPERAASEVSLGLAASQRRRSRAAARARRAGEANGSGVSKIAFGGGGVGAGRRPVAAKSPRIAFGGGGVAAGRRPVAAKSPRIAFGGGGVAAGRRPVAAKSPRIAFGSGGRSGAGGGLGARYAPSGGPGKPRRIAFGGGGVGAGRRPVAANSGRARSSRTRWTMVGRPWQRRPKQPRFSGSGRGHGPGRTRSVKSPRLRAGARSVGWLRWPRRAGDRSAVWRIGNRRMGGFR